MRVNIVKSKNAEQIYIIKSFRLNGKNTSKIQMKLGTMQNLLPLHNNSRESVLAWAEVQAANLTEKDKDDSMDILLKYSQVKQIDLNQQVLFNGGYLFLKDILFDLKIDKLCKDISNKYKFEYDLTDVISNLIYTRILYPSSKLSSFDSSKNFIEQPSFNLHHIYRALDMIAKEKSCIEATMYQNSSKLLERNTSVLYYDCTNFFFEIEEADGLKQYGVSKEHRPNPIIQMGLFMDGNGIPLAFCINAGNENEQKSLIPLEERMIRDFDLSKFIVCTDAGLASKDNRIFNNKANRSYIVTQSIKILKGHLIDWCLDPEGWALLGGDKKVNLNEIEDELCKDTVYYKERWINENGLEQRLIVSYSPKYKAYQRNIRAKQIQRAQVMVDKKVPLNKKNPNSAKRFVEEIALTSNGEVASESTLTLKQEVIDKEEQFDGFYAVCTTLEDKIEGIIKINKGRWEIEESFRIMKSEFKSRPVYLSRDDRIIAHFTICFLALLVYRILEKKLNEKYSTNQIIDTLKEMNFQDIKGEGYIPAYIRTDLTDELHEIFKFRTDTQIVSNKKMKKIIKEREK